VSGYIGAVPVAIEVQASSLDLERIAHRTKEYAAKGIFVLWLVPWRGSSLEKFYEGDDRFAPSVWEKWLHALYFGRVYYWREGAEVLPVHFDTHWLWVEATDWGGGYSLASKRFRKVKLSPNRVSISDMRGSDRPAWTGGKMSIPQSKLWIDGLSQWWKTGKKASK
jgi:competence protein CoiA